MKPDKIPSVLSFGELLWDLLPSGKMLGGAPANFTFRLQSLGVDATLVSKVGEDELGRDALAYLEEHGLDTSFVQKDSAHPTGTVPVVLDAAGVPDFTIVPSVAYDHIEAVSALRQKARESDMICFGTLIQRSAESRETLYVLLEAAACARKFLDINLRKDCYSPETVRASLAAADIVKLNEDEAHLLTKMLSLAAPALPAFCAALIETFALEACIVTRGENGAYARNAFGEEVNLPGRKVEVADTIGSGDAFSAGFVFAYLNGWPLESCCRLGNALGALVATTPGGMTHLSPEEVFAVAGCSEEA